MDEANVLTAVLPSLAMVGKNPRRRYPVGRFPPG